MYSNIRNNLTVYKRAHARLRMLVTKYVYNSYIYIYIYTYKQDLALNNLQWLTCLKTQPNRPNPIKPILAIFKKWHDLFDNLSISIFLFVFLQ